MKKILTYILLTLFFLMLVLIYGRFVGVNGLNTKEYLIYSNSIDSGYNGVKILHFSDLHYKKVITEKRVNDIVIEINNVNPDIVIFTGDLFDDDYELTKDDIDFLIKTLSKIESKYGKYAVIGDNDFDDIESLKNIYSQSNFKLLDNNFEVIKNEDNNNLFIGGISSYIKNDADTTKINEYLDKHPDIPYKIIIMHEPDYFDKLASSFDLVLAGHSLNGSINVPLIKRLFLENGAKKYYNKYYDLNDTDFYISNGIGVSNINFRLFNVPTINVYRIIKR